MTTVTQMKCACEQCLCIINLEDALKQDSKYYCSNTCASGHTDGSGCGHAGCECQ